jgi:hypothetical protein
MTKLTSMTPSSWNVICKNANKTYWWVYTFSENHTLTWKDENNGMHGSGTWRLEGGKLVIHWYPSKTVDTWDMPIDTEAWTGTCNMQSDPGNPYDLSATARNFGQETTNIHMPPPEGQLDAMACWAASLAWWTKAVPGVAARSQLSILGAGSGIWGTNGSITKESFMAFFPSQSSLRAERIPERKLDGYIRGNVLPLIIGYSSGPLGGHVNVIHTLDAEKNTVIAMDPWFPDPDKDRNYTYDDTVSPPVFINNNDGTPFKFTGVHVTRPVSYYTSKALGGEFVLAYSSSLPGVSVP